MMNKEEIEKSRTIRNNLASLAVVHPQYKDFAYEVLQYILELERELDITKTNYEILQGEMDRIGIDTLKLEPGNSTDDVIEEIEKLKKDKETLTKERNYYLARHNEFNNAFIKGRKEINKGEVSMEVPEYFRGMKKVKEYPNYVLYIDEYGRRECFQYWDLGFTTKQIRQKKVFIGNHM